MVKVFDGFHNTLINIFNVFINSKPVYPYFFICYLSYNQTNNQGCYILSEPLKSSAVIEKYLRYAFIQATVAITYISYIYLSSNLCCFLKTGIEIQFALTVD